MSKKKTSRMLSVEARIECPLETYLWDRLNGVEFWDQSMALAAQDLGISKATLGYWLMKLGIRFAGVAVRPGDRVYAIDATGNERLALEV